MALTSHERECALAALAARLERLEKHGPRAEFLEVRKLYLEILQTPIQ
jgi:hypothetical protein